MKRNVRDSKTRYEYVLDVAGEWLQVDMGVPTVVTGVVTQGRHSTRYLQRVTSFKISFGNFTRGLRTIKNEIGNDQVKNLI